MHYALPLWYLLGIVAIIKRIRIVSDAAIKRKSHSNWDVNHGVHRFPSNENIGVFHLQLLVFPFVCRFHSRIEAIVCSSFANDKFRRISTKFQNMFVVAFTLNSFALLKWDDCLSVHQVSFLYLLCTKMVKTAFFQTQL